MKFRSTYREPHAHGRSWSTRRKLKDVQRIPGYGQKGLGVRLIPAYRQTGLDVRLIPVFLPKGLGVQLIPVYLQRAMGVCEIQVFLRKAHHQRALMTPRASEILPSVRQIPADQHRAGGAYVKFRPPGRGNCFCTQDSGRSGRRSSMRTGDSGHLVLEWDLRARIRPGFRDGKESMVAQAQ